VRMLAESGEACWRSIRSRDVVALGRSLTGCLEAWKRLLPRTVPEEIGKKLEEYARFPGGIFSGSGGGYLIVASDEEVPGGFRIRIRT
jgi:hypothetical protein